MIKQATRAKAVVMLAYANGATLERKDRMKVELDKDGFVDMEKFNEKEWKVIDLPVWNWYDFKYRVKQ